MTKLTPSFKEKVWGSNRLEPLFRDSGRKIGEVWFEGADRLPWLIKFLFTTEKLSVQVHPNDVYARQHHDSAGKTEMWHILAAEPGAQIAAGFRERVTRQRLREASQSGEIENLLQWYDASPGDTFFIPAGTVHAIGAGLTLCEVQQHSDVTYRLYDYGRPRELHLDQAVEVSDFGPVSALQKAPPNGGTGVLVTCPYFTTSKLCILNSSKYIATSSKGAMLVAVEGAGTLNGHPTGAGDVWYLEEEKQEIQFLGSATFLHILP